MKVVIRADSSHLIGSGHIMRCLNLTESLMHDGKRKLNLMYELSNNAALINIYLNPHFRGHDYGKKTLSKSIRYIQKIGIQGTIRAEVKNSKLTSLNKFHNCGFA